MIVYFADRQLNILGQASTALPGGLKIVGDNKIEDVETGVSTFECKVSFDAKTRAKVEAGAEVGNFILRRHDGKDELYTIIESETDTSAQEVYMYAEDAGLDLLNEIATEFTATEAHDSDYYLTKWIGDSGFEIGINEIPTTTTLTLSWDSESTVTERLASIAKQFGDYEISYSFTIENMLVTGRYINVHKKRGNDDGLQLRLNREIDRIVTTKSIANLATAFSCTGGTPENAENPITLKGYKYDDGDFYVGERTGYLYSRKAAEKWGRYAWAKDINPGYDGVGFILRHYSYETTSQAQLCSHAIAELKKVCDMEINYEIDITKMDAEIGDRVNIVDDAGELYLSSRILLLETSVVDETKKATLGEHLIKDSGISQRVEELAAQFAQIAPTRVFYTWIAYADDESGTGISLDPTGKTYMGTATNKTVKDVDISDPTVFSWAKIKGELGEKGEDATTLRIDSSRGTVFKNSEVSTVLSAVIYKGNKRITDIDALRAEFGNSAYLEWKWQRLGETTFGTILSTDSRIGDGGFTFTLSSDDVDTKVVFMCQLVID